MDKELLPLHKVFISFHSADIGFKESLIDFNQTHKIFIDASVDTRDISDALPDQTIRQMIRDEYLRNSSVTILLVGQGTKGRKHVDWEIYSSMINGSINKRSGILAVLLPGANPGNYYTAAHDNEKVVIYPETTSWTSVVHRSEYEERYPYLPNRIIDNLLKKDVKLSVVPWDKLTASTLPLLIENASSSRLTNMYDLSRPMRRSNA